MTLRLTVQRAAWESHVGSIASSVDGLVPVVKGNGYGFGRRTLHPIAATVADRVCVGTIHELDDVAEDVTAVVLTPTLVPPATSAAVLTIGALNDVDALHGWRGRVMIKLQSSMRRYGVAPDELKALAAAVNDAGLDVAGYALHPPLAGSDEERTAEIDAWLDVLEPETEVWLSHLQPHNFAALQRRHGHRTLRLRLGTALWHGDKSFLALTADVLAVQAVSAGDRAGYRLTEVPVDGHLVMVSAGSAHGVAPLVNGDSPFHFRRTRLAMLEPPHMHTTMVFVPLDGACPAPGDRVDVQRPLITTNVDEIEWS